MKGNIIVVVVAMVCLTSLECFAIYKGINGKYLALVLMLVAGLGGFHFDKFKGIIKELWK